MFIARATIISINLYKSKFGGSYMVCKVNENGKMYTVKGKLNESELKVWICDIDPNNCKY